MGAALPALRSGERLPVILLSTKLTAERGVTGRTAGRWRRARWVVATHGREHTAALRSRGRAQEGRVAAGLAAASPGERARGRRPEHDQRRPTQPDQRR